MLRRVLILSAVVVTTVVAAQSAAACDNLTQQQLNSASYAQQQGQNYSNGYVASPGLQHMMVQQAMMYRMQQPAYTVNTKYTPGRNRALQRERILREKALKQEQERSYEADLATSEK